MKIEKRDIVLAIVLSVVTCGIYGIYWFVKLVDEVNAITKKEDALSGIVVFLLSLVTCGIYGLVWYYQAGNAIEEFWTARGRKAESSGMGYLVLSLIGFGFATKLILQIEVNKAIEVIGSEEYYQSYQSTPNNQTYFTNTATDTGAASSQAQDVADIIESDSNTSEDIDE